MSDKRKAFEAIVAKLEKLLPHLGDENTNEAGVALQRINSLLHAAKLDWHDLLALMSEQKGGSVFSDLLRRLSEKDVDVLVRLGRAGATFFCSAAGEAFADVAIGRSRITWPLSSSEFSEWLLHQFYIDADRRKAPAAAAVNSAVRTLRAHARFEGGRHEVHLRTAAVGDKIYVDVGDAEWHVIEISPNDWRVVKDAPVRFRPTTGMAALPLPQRGCSINRLRPFVNFTGADFVIYVSALVDALRPGAPHPVIYFAGDEGSTKSTAEKIMLSLVDPSDFPLRTLPGTVRELFVNANGAQMLAFDNVSSISPAISDALCQIATGSGIAMRKLFTDSDLVLIGGSRTVVLSGLLNVISRSDLADRAVIMLLPVLVPENRRAEAEFWRAFNAERPAIFGALLDIVAYGLSRLPQTRLQRLPRMADFAVWATACEGAFAEPGAFLAAFDAHAAEAIDVVIENDPVATAIAAFMHGGLAWTGTATELLCELSGRDRAEAQPSRWKSWPKDPAEFGKAVRRVKGALRKVGIEVTIGRAPDRIRTRMVELRRIEPQPSQTDVAGAADGTDSADGGRAIAKVIPIRGS
jgi:hypothetical protein